MSAADVLRRLADVLRRDAVNGAAPPPPAPGDPPRVVHARGEDGTRAALRNLFGSDIDLAHLPALAGAEPGTVVTALPDRHVPHVLRLFVDHPEKHLTGDRTLRRGPDGKPVLHIGLEETAPGSPLRGRGYKRFARTVEAARAVGVPKITLEAVSGGGYNGLQAWPKYGFDGPLGHLSYRMPHELRREAFGGPATFHRLRGLPGYDGWLKAVTGTAGMVFHTAPDSPHSQILAEYTRARDERANANGSGGAGPAGGAGAGGGGGRAAAGGGGAAAAGGAAGEARGGEPGAGEAAAGPDRRRSVAERLARVGGPTRYAAGRHGTPDWNPGNPTPEVAERRAADPLWQAHRRSQQVYGLDHWGEAAPHFRAILHNQIQYHTSEPRQDFPVPEGFARWADAHDRAQEPSTDADYVLTRNHRLVEGDPNPPPGTAALAFNHPDNVTDYNALFAFHGNGRRPWFNSLWPLQDMANFAAPHDPYRLLAASVLSGNRHALPPLVGLLKARDNPAGWSPVWAALARAMERRVGDLPHEDVRRRVQAVADATARMFSGHSSHHAIAEAIRQTGDITPMGALADHFDDHDLPQYAQLVRAELANVWPELRIPTGPRRRLGRPDSPHRAVAARLAAPHRHGLLSSLDRTARGVGATLARPLVSAARAVAGEPTYTDGGSYVGRVGGLLGMSQQETANAALQVAATERVAGVTPRGGPGWEVVEPKPIDLRNPKHHALGPAHPLATAVARQVKRGEARNAVGQQVYRSQSGAALRQLEAAGKPVAIGGFRFTAARNGRGRRFLVVGYRGRDGVERHGVMGYDEAFAHLRAAGDARHTDAFVGAFGPHLRAATQSAGRYPRRARYARPPGVPSHLPELVTPEQMAQRRTPQPRGEDLAATTDQRPPAERLADPAPPRPVSPPPPDPEATRWQSAEAVGEPPPVSDEGSPTPLSEFATAFAAKAGRETRRLGDGLRSKLVRAGRTPYSVAGARDGLGRRLVVVAQHGADGGVLRHAVFTHGELARHTTNPANEWLARHVKKVVGKLRKSRGGETVLRYAMEDGQAILRAAFERPDDETPHLVYADWADDHGMPELASHIRGAVQETANEPPGGYRFHGVSNTTFVRGPGPGPSNHAVYLHPVAGTGRVHVLTPHPDGGTVRVSFWTGPRLPLGEATEATRRLLAEGHPPGNHDAREVAATMPQRFARPARYMAPRTDFLDALRRTRSSNMRAVHQAVGKVAQRLGISGHKTVDALYDTAAASVPGVAQALGGRVTPEVARYAAAWHGLLSDSPAVAVFHVGQGDDLLHRFRMAGAGGDVRQKLDGAGIARRHLIPHRQGWDILVPDRGGRLAGRVRAFADSQGSPLETSRGTLETLGAADKGEARAKYRAVVTQFEGKVRRGRGGRPLRYMMGDGEAILRAAHDRPDDATPHLVYADWADDQGLPELAGHVRDAAAGGRAVHFPSPWFGHETGRHGVALSQSYATPEVQWVVSAVSPPEADGSVWWVSPPAGRSEAHAHARRLLAEGHQPLGDYAKNAAAEAARSPDRLARLRGLLRRCNRDPFADYVAGSDDHNVAPRPAPPAHGDLLDAAMREPIGVTTPRPQPSPADDLFAPEMLAARRATAAPPVPGGPTPAKVPAPVGKRELLAKKVAEQVRGTRFGQHLMQLKKEFGADAYLGGLIDAALTGRGVYRGGTDAFSLIGRRLRQYRDAGHPLAKRATAFATAYRWDRAASRLEFDAYVHDFVRSKMAAADRSDPRLFARLLHTYSLDLAGRPHPAGFDRHYEQFWKAMRGLARGKLAGQNSVLGQAVPPAEIDREVQRSLVRLAFREGERGQVGGSPTPGSVAHPTHAAGRQRSFDALPSTTRVPHTVAYRDRKVLADPHGDPNRFRRLRERVANLKRAGGPRRMMFEGYTPDILNHAAFCLDNPTHREGLRALADHVYDSVGDHGITPEIADGFLDWVTNDKTVDESLAPLRHTPLVAKGDFRHDSEAGGPTSRGLYLVPHVRYGHSPTPEQRAMPAFYRGYGSPGWDRVTYRAGVGEIRGDVRPHLRKASRRKATTHEVVRDLYALGGVPAVLHAVVGNYHFHPSRHEDVHANTPSKFSRDLAARVAALRPSSN